MTRPDLGMDGDAAIICLVERNLDEMADPLGVSNSSVFSSGGAKRRAEDELGPLHLAVRTNQLSGLKRLLEMKVRVSCRPRLRCGRMGVGGRALTCVWRPRLPCRCPEGRG